jgi:hypothetical protein
MPAVLGTSVGGCLMALWGPSAKQIPDIIRPRTSKKQKNLPFAIIANNHIYSIDPTLHKDGAGHLAENKVLID